MAAQPWLDEAWREFGEHERTGAAGNPRILAFYRDAGHPGIARDETAWCAAFVGACLARSGLRGTGSLMARSYLDWGEPAALDQRLGAVAVLSRGADPSLGHVGFLLAETPQSIILLGGNQDDSSPWPGSKSPGCWACVGHPKNSPRLRSPLHPPRRVRGRACPRPRNGRRLR